MSVRTSAIEQAYANARRAETIYETLEMGHVTFAEPVRVVTGVDEDMSFRLTDGGAPVLFKALALSVTLPGFTEDGPTPAKVRIDNVSSLLLPYLRAAIQSDDPITVIYRAYTSVDLSGPGDVIDGLELTEVTLTATAAEGTLRFKELELQAFPLATYDQQYYPALQDD